jgi:hypothetical protein
MIAHLAVPAAGFRVPNTSMRAREKVIFALWRV